MTIENHTQQSVKVVTGKEASIHLPVTVAKRPIRSRFDLPFVGKMANGHTIYWNVRHDQNHIYDEHLEIGIAFADALMELAEFDPVDAYIVVRLIQSSMARGGWGEETGFMQQIARYAFAGRSVFGRSIPANKDAKLRYDEYVEQPDHDGREEVAA